MNISILIANCLCRMQSKLNVPIKRLAGSVSLSFFNLNVIVSSLQLYFTFFESDVSLNILIK